MWRQDVEFVAALYNVFLRRDQINAVEVYFKPHTFSQNELEELRGLTAAGLIANAITSAQLHSLNAQPNGRA